MKKNSLTFLSFLGAAMLTLNFSAAYAADTPRLIVRADDMGSSRASNLACLQSANEGIVKSIEVMPVCAWFPETVRMLKANPQIDVGLHLILNSEWDNIKWRPLTDCPSLVDDLGYFTQRINPNGDLKEIEQEFRAQIEFTLKQLPQVSHLSGHCGSMSFRKDVKELSERLAKEYHLALEWDKDLQWVGYKGARGTSEEKIASFSEMLKSLEPGKSYMFLDHPAYNNQEMEGVYHKGYEQVATDRQGVTDLFTSDAVKNLIQEKGIELISYNQFAKSLPRSTVEAENVDPAMLDNYIASIQDKKQNIHSIMVLRNGKVVAEKWMGNGAPNRLHSLNSVSKTYTSTAIGFAVQEGLIKVTDKVISFFPDKLPEKVSPELEHLEIRHLLMMSTGQPKEPGRLLIHSEYTDVDIPSGDWVKEFLAVPFTDEPGTVFRYNSFATFMLSAIIQKVTGEKVIDFLYPRLFRPLGITGITWAESPEGINCGGWGLKVKTEDMAKLGLFLLQKGNWNGEQLLCEDWVNEATTAKIMQNPNASEDLKKRSDWVQGYCYQMWRCRNNAFRADGAAGQYIIMIPEKNAVVAITAELGDMQSEIDVVWDIILPALK